MKKAMLWAMAACLATPSAHALSLEQARQMAHANYPAIRQYRLIDQSRDYTLDNAAKGWLPTVSLAAGAAAFTDLVKTSQQMEQMGISMNNYMAQATLVVRQNVYDGGQIAAQKQVASAQSEVQRRQLDVSVYAIYERIHQIYFGILLLDEQLAQNELLLLDLSTSEKTIRSLMKGGVANQGDLETLLVEKLKATQQKESLLASRKAYRSMLGVFLGKQLPDSETLEMPSASVPIGTPATDSLAEKHSNCTVSPGERCVVGDVSHGAMSSVGNCGTHMVFRPELAYYTSQNQLLDAQRRQLDAKLRPTVALFGMGMLHSPVSGMLNSGVLAAGVSLSWNIGALYTRKNDLRKLETQRAMNESLRATFLFQTRLQNEEADGSIEALRRQIARDDEIVRLRESIRSRSDRRVQLGTESVNDLVGDINAVALARAQKAQHEIQLLQEIYKQKNINNE